MSIIQAIFGKKTPTSENIAAEIERARADLDAATAKRDAVLASIATMSDDEHRAAEETAEARRRAAERAKARIAVLETAHADAVATEVEASRLAANEALRKRAEASRHANDAEAAKILTEYDKLATQMGDKLARLAAIDLEREAVNGELRVNPVAETVPAYSDVHRKMPDQEAAERTQVLPCHVYRYPGAPRDTEKLKWVQYQASEEVLKATIGPDGKPLSVGPVLFNNGARSTPIHPTLENREVVVSRTRFRLGRREESLGQIRLPPAFAGGTHHWPR